MVVGNRVCSHHLDKFRLLFGSRFLCTFWGWGTGCGPSFRLRCACSRSWWRLTWRIFLALYIESALRLLGRLQSLQLWFFTSIFWIPGDLADRLIRNHTILFFLESLVLLYLGRRKFKHLSTCRNIGNFGNLFLTFLFLKLHFLLTIGVSLLISLLISIRLLISVLIFRFRWCSGSSPDRFWLRLSFTRTQIKNEGNWLISILRSSFLWFGCLLHFSIHTIVVPAARHECHDCCLLKCGMFIWEAPK